MKMKMIPTGNYLLVDVWEDLTERYVNIAYPNGRPKLPDGRDLPTGLVGMQKFTASYELQQCLLDEFMAGYYTDLEGIKKIPRGFWRDKVGNDAIWSGVTPEILSTESEWIFVSRTDYTNLLHVLGMGDVQGNDLVADSKKAEVEPTSRRPMSGADITKAADLLRAEIRTKRLTRDDQRLWVRQAFADKSVTEADCRKIFDLVPAKIGAPSKTDKKA